MSAFISSCCSGAKTRLSSAYNNFDKKVIQTRPAQFTGRVISGTVAVAGVVGTVELAASTLQAVVQYAPTLKGVAVVGTLAAKTAGAVSIAAGATSVVPVVILAATTTAAAYGTFKLAQYAICGNVKPKSE